MNNLCQFLLLATAAALAGLLLFLLGGFSLDYRSQRSPIEYGAAR